MNSGLRENVKKELARVLDESRILWNEADLLPYVKDTFRIRFDEDYKYFPDFVVLPETTTEVQGIVGVASEHKIPLIPKGGGSNRTGMLVPIHGGIVVDTIRMNRVLEISPPNLYVTVQTGITLKELESRLAEHGLALNQEQGSFKIATVGGSIATSGFSRKHQKYGTIADRVMSLEVVLANGKVLRTGPKVLYTSTGYRLHQLFIASEGTLGIITEATLRVEPLPEAKDVTMAFYDDFWGANEVAQRMMASCVTFASSEAFGVDDASDYGAPAGKQGIFYASFEGIKGEVEAEKAYVDQLIRETGGIVTDPKSAWRFYEKYTVQWCGARALTGFEDALTTYVPMERMREFYDKLWNDVMPRHGTTHLPGEKYSLDVGRYRIVAGRFHIREGAEGWNEYQRLLRDVAALATGLGGSISTCHGVGIEHKNNLDLEYSPVALRAMRSIKKVFDPDNIMNPGKKLPDEEA
ncbi:MAG TPA: FAD-binding oxidoreductase [Thermoplasmata archaeon]|nr:FAD-binding oxidoreductase [Thermoplasmata archaeon]